jgi:hypothetical protein
MSDRCNGSEVAQVAPHWLMVPMQHMIATERGLAMLHGLSQAQMREVDHAIWEALEGDRERRVAVLLRFRALIKVFAARPLAELFLHRGFMLIAPAVHVAARMRLDAQRGFPPLKFERVLRDLLCQLDEGVAQGRDCGATAG